MSFVSRFRAASIGVLALLAASQAFAQGATIAVVNMQGVLHDSSAVKTMREQIEAKQKSAQAEFSKREDTLRKEEGELKAQKGVLSREALEEKGKAFQAKVNDFQKDFQNRKNTIDNGVERAQAEVLKTIGEIVAEIAKEKGVSVAMPTQQLLYADSSLDISAEVLKRLNARLPRVDVKFDAPASAKSDSKKK